jgi:hypothetical protein
MDSIDLSAYDSSESNIELNDSIKNGKDNTLNIENLSHKINFNNELVLYDENLLHQYKGYLSQYCTWLSVPESYYYHPELIAKELYGTVDLWYLIFWFNDIPSFEEYNKSKIKVFNPAYFSVINRLLQTNTSYLKSANSDPELINDCTLTKVRIKGNQVL